MAFKMKSGNKPSFKEIGTSPLKIGVGIVKAIRKIGYDINKATGEEMPTMTVDEMKYHDPKRAKKIKESGQATQYDTKTGLFAN
jgi:hypothetical protein